MNNTTEVTIWEKCLQIIKDNLSQTSFKTWFSPIKPVQFQDNKITLQLPSFFFYEYIEENYAPLLKKILHKVTGENIKIEYKVLTDSGNDTFTTLPDTNLGNKIANAPTTPPISKYSETVIQNPFVIPGIQKIKIDPQLNSDYSFENFIEGKHNRLARSASYSVSENPGKTSFNPLFIYGGTGLGKTHLAQAIGIEIKQKQPELIVLYVTANKFMTQYTESIRTNKKNDFLHFYQMIEVLIIDDIHDWIGKEGTQKEFFNIFNQLHQQKKQIILTSDKAPSDLSGMEERLISRFKWGLSVELETPDFDTRVKILKHKNYLSGVTMSDEVVNYIASHFTQHVRELEGALNALHAHSILNKNEITLDLAKQIVDTLVKNTRKEISIDYIQKVVCDYFNIPLNMIGSKTRKREIVQVRQIAMYFAKQLTKASLSSIGTKIGNKDHATVLHACKTVNNLIDTDKRFKIDIEEIGKKLKN
jgi:chromosomal replication initiator protein